VGGVFSAGGIKFSYKDGDHIERYAIGLASSILKESYLTRGRKPVVTDKESMN